MFEFLNTFFMFDFANRVKDFDWSLQVLQGILEVVLKLAFLQFLIFAIKEKFFSRILKIWKKKDKKNE